jgi:hypothetical protein
MKLPFEEMSQNLQENLQVASKNLEDIKKLLVEMNKTLKNIEENTLPQ